MKSYALGWRKSLRRELAITAGIMLICCGVSASESAYLISSTTSCAGHRSTNTILLAAKPYALVGTLAQACGISIFTNADKKCLAGFLNGAFACQPTKDTDQDGLANEYDPDNDNDMLTDVAELCGGEFDPPCMTDPNNPDTDGDSLNDGAEAIAGCNPTSAASFFSIWPPSPIDAMNGYVIRWNSASNRYYSVSVATGAPSAFVLVGSGIPATYPVNTFTDLIHNANNRLLYRVGVRR
jgi:hypothetical protein